MKNLGILGASRDGDNPTEIRVMQDIGTALAGTGKTVRVGCMTGQLESFAKSFLEAGGNLEVFLIPKQQQNSIDVCERLGVSFEEVDRDNTRTLKLLESDAWISTYLSLGSIGETARGVTWNQDRKIRGSVLTPHFILARSNTNIGLMDTYRAAAFEGRANSELVDELFVPFRDGVELVDQMRQVEERACRF